MNAAGRIACLLLAAGFTGHATASSLDDWRERAAQIRQLAENNAPRAYEEARKLQASLPPSATAADKAQALNLLARAEVYLARTDDSATHSAEALALAKSANDTTDRIEADLNIARNAVNQGRMDSLTEAVKDGMEAIGSTQRAELRAEMMLYAATTYRRFGQVDKATTLAMQALDIARRDGNPMALAYAEYGMGITYVQSGRAQEAREHYERMLTAAREAHSTWLEGAAILGLADTEGKAGDNAAMVRDTQAAIALYQRAGGPFFASHARHMLAAFYDSHGQPAKALALFNENEALYKQHDNPIGLWWTLTARSRVWQELGRKREARDDAAQAQTLAEKIGLPLYRAESARHLAELAAEEGDFRQAYALSAKADEVSTEAEKKKDSEHILQLAQRYQDESHQRQVDELKRRNEEQAEQARMIRIILAASVVLLIVTVIFLLNLRRSREKIRALNASLEARVAERTEALRRSQQTLSEAQRIAHIGSWELDLLTNELKWSDEIYRIFEIDPVEFGASYAAFLDAVHPDDRERVASAYALSLQNRAPYDIEHCLSMPDGRIKYVHERCETVFDDDGKPLRSLGTVQDITGRKLAEQQLKEALELAEGIINAIPDLLFEVDREGRYLNIWARNPELLAAQKEALLGKTVRDVFTPENADAALAAIREADERGRSLGKTICIELPDGPHWFEHSLAKKTGGPLSDTTFLVLSRDVTERMRMEEALKASEMAYRGNSTLLRSVLESSPEVIVFALDREFCYLAFNEKHRETMRAIWGRDIVVGESMLDVIVSQSDRDKARRDFERALAGESFVSEDAYGDEALERLYWQIHWSPIRADNGDIIGVTCFTINITERKRMEQALAEQEREFRSLAENMPDNIARWDCQGRYLYINPTHERTLGVSAQEVIGKEIPASHDQVKAAIAEVAASGKATVVVRQTVLAPNGEKQFHDVSIVPERDSEGKVVSVLGIGRDMTNIYRMQETLAAREHEFRSLAESSPDYVVRYDREGRCRYYNSSLLAHLGLTNMEETLGKRPSEIWPDGRFDNIEQAAAKAVESGEIVTFEMVNPLPSGEADYYQIRVVPERDAAGQIIGTIAFGTDITLSKRLEVSLRQQRDFQESLLNAMNDVGMQIMMIENGRIIHVSNRKIAGEFGYSGTDIAAHPALLDIIHPDDQAWVMDYHRRRTAGENLPTSYEVGLVTRSGERREYETSVAVVPGTEPVRIISVGKDITERKQNERRLKEALEFSEGVISAIPDMLFEMNKEGRYLNIWTHTPELLAAQKEALLGHTVNEMLLPESAATVMEALREAEESGVSFGKVIRVDMPQESKWFEESVSRKPGGSPDDPRFLVLSRDVTERMNYETAREKALTEAVRLAKTRRDFLSHMSHELRTPLNSILGYTQLLQRDRTLNGHNAEAIGIIRKSGEHLLSLIEDILDLARIEAGRFQLDIGDIALATFLHVVADIVGVQAQEKGIGFFCELAPGLPAGIRGDEKRLRQVLLNLLANAIKFTDRGKVTLRVRQAAPSRLAFEVEDTGVGIPASELNTIFQPFEQSGDVRQRLGGSGLGLSISQQLVRLMGGGVTVESRVGEGSIFRFELELPEAEMGQTDTLTDFVIPSSAPAQDETSAPLAAPPHEELQALHRLALLGNMRDIVQHAERIENLDPRYRPFAARLRELAEGYQSKAILAFVERHLT